METTKFNYDYSKIMWMKMFLATPDYQQNCSDVKINFEQALQIIQIVDNLTQGIQKIVYLVGWQGLGHDDCYPEMEIVNPFLKRECDDTARDSLLWLISEAKKYHTVVSVHGNISDEYEANPSHQEMVEAGAIVKNADGSPAVIEVFNGRNAYKVSYKQYWESGLFHKHWSRFCETVPVREAGTVHLDNFCIAESFSPRTTMDEQNEARNAILDYIQSQGIDVTSEYTYRELSLRADSAGHPIRKFYAQNVDALPPQSDVSAPIRTLGRIPATWWTSSLSPEECMKIPASDYSGHLSGALGNVFYGDMHGEDIWLNHGIDPEAWVPFFLCEFCNYQLPYLYLNRFERLKLEKIDDSFNVTFSDGVESCGADRSITKDGVPLKSGNDVILPLDEQNSIFIVYSETGRNGFWAMPDASFEKCLVYEITPEGNQFLNTCRILNGGVELHVQAGQALVIKEDF